jgi:hypothetical protein
MTTGALKKLVRFTAAAHKYPRTKFILNIRDYFIFAPSDFQFFGEYPVYGKHQYACLNNRDKQPDYRYAAQKPQ